ncbi:MAG TPA: helix-turn-helix domain-containing protein [Solirubrobacteraceae bacterium]|nr:helix-turn-helix domain-containing protein [Solirubrobacteraceae bacterium]
MALLDLLGRRWALRVLWELRGEGAATFRELQMRCGDVSSSVLNERVRELRDAGIVAGRTTDGESRAASGYRLTAEGHELLRALGPLDEWAAGWARSMGGV